MYYFSYSWMDFFCLVFIILKVFAMKNYFYERYFSNLHLHYWCFQTNVSTWKLTKGHSSLKKELFSFCQEERHGTFVALKVFSSNIHYAWCMSLGPCSPLFSSTLFQRSFVLPFKLRYLRLVFWSPSPHPFKKMVMQHNGIKGGSMCAH